MDRIIINLNYLKTVTLHFNFSRNDSHQLIAMKTGNFDSAMRYAGDILSNLETLKLGFSDNLKANIQNIRSHPLINDFMSKCSESYKLNSLNTCIECGDSEEAEKLCSEIMGNEKNYNK